MTKISLKVKVKYSRCFRRQSCIFTIQNIIQTSDMMCFHWIITIFSFYYSILFIDWDMNLIIFEYHLLKMQFLTWQLGPGQNLS